MVTAAEVQITKLLGTMRRESAVDLAREAVWRTARRWRQSRLPRQLKDIPSGVTFVALGYYRPCITQVGSRSRNAIIRYADSICAGRFPWFAYGPVNLGFPPRWDFDFVSAQQWPQTRSATPPVVRYDGSDVKVPWELSRLQFLPVLSKAFLLSGDERYRRGATELVGDWMRGNPVNFGVNWTIAMEAALRSMSICFMLDLLVVGAQLETSWLETVTQCLWEHLLFIEANLEFSHLTRSNHYLSNVVGLLCLSTFLKGPEMDERRKLYSKLVDQEMRLQVYADGGNYEASTGYHLLVLQMFTAAFRLMQKGGIEPADEFTVRLRKMYRWTAALANENGRVPHVGDCDDGRVELLTDDLEAMLKAPLERYSLCVASQMAVGQSLLGEDYAACRDEGAWYGVAPATHPKRGESDRARTVLFPNSGVAVVRRGDAEVLFLNMPNGVYGKGSHTHNDKLSVLLSIRGRGFLVDCGSGCYTRDAALRNQLRSTGAHNTVQFDGEEQNRFSTLPSGLFSISDEADVTPITIEETAQRVSLHSAHGGYRRLGITHRRVVTLTEQAMLVIEDRFASSGQHDFRACFQLPPDWQVLTPPQAGLKISCSVRGPSAANLEFQAPVELHLSVTPGKISRAYGTIDEGTTISVRGSFRASMTLLTTISWRH